MRILIAHSAYLAGPVSGENRVAEDEATLLREAGHDVATWTPAPSEGGPARLLQTGARAIWSRQATGTIAELVRRHRSQVVHVHNLFPMLSPAAIRAARREGAAVVMTLHNYRLLCLPATFLRDDRTCELCLGHIPWRGVRYRCFRGSVAGSAALATSLTLHRGLGTFGRVSRFLAVSEFVRRKHVTAGLPADRISVKPNFAWAAPRRVGPGEHFIFVGRLGPEKGIGTLVDAWRDVPAPLVIVGAGPEAERLAATAPATVRLLGTLPPHEVAGWIGRARALLIPSILYEGAPRTVVEAYASGVPVLASRIGALPEAVEDGSSGLLVNPGDRSAWAQASRRLLDDSLSERLGEGAFRLWTARFGPERALENLESSYREALAAS